MRIRSRVFPGTQRCTDELKPHAPGALDQHHVPRLTELRGEGRRLARVGNRMALPVEPARGFSRQGTHGHEEVDAGVGCLLPQLLMELALPRTELQHVADAG